MDTQLLIAELFFFLFMTYSPPYFSVNGMMISVLVYKNGFKSKHIMAYRNISFCLWHIDVGLQHLYFCL